MGDTELLAKYLSVPLSLAARILEGGITPQAVARADIPTLTDPFGHPGVPDATDRIGDAMRRGQSIVLRCGESPDATAAAATILKALRTAGGKGSLSDEKGDLAIALGPGTAESDAEIVVCGPSSGAGPPIRAGSAQGIVSLFAFYIAHALLLSGERHFGKKLVAVDTETTGKNPRSDEIIEIGAAVLEGNSIGETFQTLVNPERKIPAEVVRITGITNDDIAGAPPPAAALSAFLEFIGEPGKTVLVAHNAEFDRDFLQHGIRKHLKKKIRFETIDTLEMARRLHPAGSQRLAHVAEKLGITVEGWHRALGDAVLAANIFFTLSKQQNAELRDLKLKRHMDVASLGLVASGKALDGDCAVVIKNGLPRYQLDRCEELLAEVRGRPDPRKVVELLLARFFAHRKNQLGAVALLAPILKGGQAPGKAN